MASEPTVVDRAEQPYVAVSSNVTMDNIVSIATRHPEVFSWLAARGLSPAGPPFLRYNIIDMATTLEIEAGVQVSATVETDGAVLAGVLPAGRYATSTHVGHPDGLMGATGDLFRWAEERAFTWDVSDTQRVSGGAVAWRYTAPTPPNSRTRPPGRPTWCSACRTEPAPRPSLAAGARPPIAPASRKESCVHNASLTLDPAFRIAEVDPRIFGSFVEHMGRCVYTGIYEPDHPTANELGFRQDVAGLVRDLGVPIVRYPGGNFVSGYNWEDGVGPRDQRPTRLDGAWRSIESNQVGVDHFQEWANSVGTETMMAVNLGTRGVDAARALVEYCNHPSGTALSDQRRSNGAADPYGIKLWCLGNEMDGPWQIGHKTAYEYGRLAKESAKAMRLVDPRIELVACGSSNSRMPTFGTWEATVLAECYDEVDYISMHTYYEEHNGDRDSFLASAVDMDHFIDDVVATADHARAVGRHKKRINISFDEWNVWYVAKFVGEKNLEWEQHPRLIEDTYSVTDAVVVGTLLNSLLRHADRVSIACLAQLVNVIAPIRSEPGGQAWRQTIYHPFALTSKYGRGTVLRLEPSAPMHDTAWQGEVPVLDAVAVLDEESVSVTLFLVNRDQTKPIALDVHVGGFPDLRVGEHTTLSDADPEAVNSAEVPDRVVPVAQGKRDVDGGRLAVQLPPLSWNMLRLLPDQVGRR